MIHPPGRGSDVPLPVSQCRRVLQRHSCIQSASQDVSQPTWEPRREGRRALVGAMAVAFPELFLIAADLTLASALSCFLYVFACFCLASLTGSVVFYSSLRVAKKMKGKVHRKGRNILSSRSSLGQVLLKTLDRVGFRVRADSQLPESDWAAIQEEERSSNSKETQVPVAEQKHQKEIPTRTKSHRKGTPGVRKKPSATRWEEEAELGQPNSYERKQKNRHVTPAFLIALLFVPTKLVCRYLKNRGLRLLTTLMKFQD